MRCPNCGAECSDQALECDFCGHAFIEGVETPAAAPTPPPVEPVSSGRATFTASEPTYTAPQANYTPPPPTPSENPYTASYPSASNPSKTSYPAGSVPNYLVWAILATLFCCLPGGIVAIVYAAQVDGKLAAGDYQGALESSNNAKLWSWISFGVPFAFGVIYFLFVILVVAMGGAN